MTQRRDDAKGEFFLLNYVAFTVLAALLSSCAATSVKRTWKAPEAHGSVGKIAVLTIDERTLLRQGFENRFVREFEKAGSPALVTHDLLSLPEIKQDKQAAAARFRDSGADALVILRLVDVNMSYREVRPGPERYAGVATGFADPGFGWYDYYGMAYEVAFMDMSPTYSQIKHYVTLETRLYDLKTEKHLWSGQTVTILKENMDRVAQMDPLVETIIGAMRKDGVIP